MKMRDIIQPVCQRFREAGFVTLHGDAKGTGISYTPDLVAIRRERSVRSDALYGTHLVVPMIVIQSTKSHIRLSTWTSFRSKWSSLVREYDRSGLRLYILYRYTGQKKIEHDHRWRYFAPAMEQTTYPIIGIDSGMLIEAFLSRLISKDEVIL